MGGIFLSHSTVDKLAAIALKKWLDHPENGYGEVFLDDDGNTGIKAGERWQEALTVALSKCDAVVCLISPEWDRSQWCFFECQYAKTLGKQIVGVFLKEVSAERMGLKITSEWQTCRLYGEGSTEDIQVTYQTVPQTVKFLAEGLKRLRDGLRNLRVNADIFEWPPAAEPRRSPFRGLEPLDTQDAAVFFGRDVEIMHGLDALRRLLDNPARRLFVILAASGTGKSSFLRAGLYPRLQRNEHHFFPLPVIRPETAPIHGDRGLASALAKAMGQLKLPGSTPGKVKARLSVNSQGTEALVNTTDQVLQNFRKILRDIQQAATRRLISHSGESMGVRRPPTLVLPVDQAEELFNADAHAEARLFLQLIAGILKAPQVPSESDGPSISLIVAVTVRTDRYEPLQTAAEFQGLEFELFDELKPMPPDRYREVILGLEKRAPVSEKDNKPFKIHPELVDRLVRDCGKEGDPLPLLAFTLERLYHDFGEGGELRPEHYSGLKRMFEQRIDSVLEGDETERARQLEILKTAFIPWLITINSKNDQPMRRVALTSQLPKDSIQYLDKLVINRLLLSDARDGQRVMEIAHEALLRNWPWLEQELRLELADLKEAEALEIESKDWTTKSKHGQEDISRLWRGQRLNNAERLLKRPGFQERLNGCCTFIERCRKIDDEEQSTLAASERRGKRGFQWALAFALIAIFVTGYFAYNAKHKSIALTNANISLTNALNQALDQIREASRFDAATAQQLLADGKWQEAVAYLGRAIRYDPLNTNAQDALWMTLNYGHRDGGTLPIAIISTDDAFIDASFSPNGTLVVDATSGTNADILDTSSLKPIGPPLSHQDLVSTASFSPNGKQVVTVSANTAQIWNVTNSKPIGLLLNHKSRVSSASFSLDGKSVVTSSDDNTAQVWDSDTGKARWSPMNHEGRVISASFSPNGTRVLTVSSNTAQMWNVTNSRPIGKPLNHKGLVTSASFSPDGTRVVTASEDTTARVWDAETGEAIGQSLNHSDIVNSASFSPDGTRVVTASKDTTAQVWDVETSQKIGTPLKHGENVYKASFSPDGLRIVTASRDKTSQVWDATTGHRIGPPLSLGRRDRVYAANFSPDGKQVLTRVDKSLVLWNVSTGEHIGLPLPHRLAAASASVSGQTLVQNTNYDLTAQVWKVATGEPMRLPISPNEWVINTSFTSDGKRMVTLSANAGQVRDAETGKTTGRPLQHSNHVNSASISLDGKWVVTVSSNTAQIWNVTNGQPIGPPLTHKGLINSASFSSNGLLVVTASSDLTARIWDARIWDAKTQLRTGPDLSHQSEVTYARFSPDNRRVATVASKFTAQVWDAITCRPIGPALSTESEMIYLGFSPDNMSVVTVGPKFTLQIWDASPGKPINAELAETLTSVICGAKLVPKLGNLQDLSASERTNIWRRFESSIKDFTGWYELGDQMFRVDPRFNRFSTRSNLTVRQAAICLLETDLDENIRAALLIDPVNPLLPFAFAKLEIAANSNPNIRRAKWLVEYGMKHLDPNISASDRRLASRLVIELSKMGTNPQPLAKTLREPAGKE